AASVRVVQQQQGACGRGVEILLCDPFIHRLLQPQRVKLCAVIPKFIKLIQQEKEPVIYGDGTQSRDFTYVENNVWANIQACTAEKAAGEVFNIACGNRYTLLDLVRMINEILGRNVEPKFAPERPGDVKHSLADIHKAKELLGYEVRVSFREGLEKTIDFFQ
ncbi:MAG: GDP-mannose 4,6-dehydratase, partial [Candidatus Syntrophosphaera sp.]